MLYWKAKAKIMILMRIAMRIIKKGIVACVLVAKMLTQKELCNRQRILGLPTTLTPNNVWSGQNTFCIIIKHVLTHCKHYLNAVVPF